MKVSKVIIVEDEPGASNNLRSILGEVAPHFQVMAVLRSIGETVKWLVNESHPDLGFFDIQLEDGLSLDIFKKTEVDFPVIFTTAYDQYAIDAFKVNSIDYLLKPIDEKALSFSIRKFERIKQANLDSDVIQKIVNSMKPKELTSLLVHYKNKLIPVHISDISYFFIVEGLVHACNKQNQKYPLELSLDDLEAGLNGVDFFRANRQYIINRTSITDIEFYFNGRLALNLQPQPTGLVLISKARVPIFKNWFNQL